MARGRNFKSIAAAAVCAALVSSSAFGIMRELQGFRAPHGGAKEAVKGFLWLEA